MRNKNTFRMGLAILAIGIGTMLYPLTLMVSNQLTSEARMQAFLDNEPPPEQWQAQQAQAVQYHAGLDGSANGAVDPFGMEAYATASPIAVPEGEVFAYVSLPKLNEHLPVYLGASDYHLSLGAAHVDGTNLPLGEKIVVQSSRHIVVTTPSPCFCTSMRCNLETSLLFMF